MKPCLTLAAAALALGACTTREAVRAPLATQQAPRYASLDAILDAGLAPRQATRSATPVVVLPTWIGRPVLLRERDGADAFEQVVSLARAPKGDARGNLVFVAMPHTEANAEDRSSSTASPPTEAGIRTELDRIFPGIAMRIVARPASNAYGPYGLAIGGRAAGTRCLYAWQWIEAAPALEGGKAAPVSLRLRLCRDDITLEAMAATMNQLTLVPRFEGQPVAPTVASATASPVQPRRRRPRHTRITQAVRPAPALAFQPAEAALPHRQAGHRYLSDAEFPLPAARPPASAPVNRGAVANAPAGLGGPAPTARAGAITADLPPEAYRGPGGVSTAQRP